MSDLEKAFLEHLGDTFTPYVGRPKTVPLPQELESVRRRAQERARAAKLREIEEAKARAEEEAQKRGLPSFEEVCEMVCRIYEVPLEDVMSPQKSRRILAARHHIMVLGYDLLQMSYSELGRLMKRDHAAVMHAVQSFDEKFGKVPAGAEVNKLLQEVISSRSEK